MVNVKKISTLTYWIVLIIAIKYDKYKYRNKK